MASRGDPLWSPVYKRARTSHCPYNFAIGDFRYRGFVIPCLLLPSFWVCNPEAHTIRISNPKE
nr:MAG TPA: hypothetical protein [Caudoviricetes sp.]